MENQPGAELQALQQQLKEAQDQAELNLIQLNQVQKELEFYFNANQRQEAELDRYRRVLQATESLISTLLTRLEKSG